MFLYHYYVQFCNDRFKTGQWIIEQSIGMNTTPHTAIAEIIVKHNYTADYLIQRIGIDDEMSQVTKAMYQVICRPWNNIVTPAIPCENMAQGDNIAFLSSFSKDDFHTDGKKSPRNRFSKNVPQT